MSSTTVKRRLNLAEKAYWSPRLDLSLIQMGELAIKRKTKTLKLADGTASTRSEARIIAAKSYGFGISAADIAL